MELNQDVDVFRNVLNPKSSIRLIGDESEGIENKLEFYKAIKNEIPIKEEYMSHIVLLQELIDEYEIK